MDWKIRKAKLTDAPLIAANWSVLMRQNERFNRALLKSKPNAKGIYKKFLARQIRSRNAAVFVAECGGKIIGHAMVSKKKLPPVFQIDEEAYVDELFVKAGFRGKGIGTLLLSEAEKWARGRKMAALGLTANVKNHRAQAVYSKFGLACLKYKMVKLLK